MNRNYRHEEIRLRPKKKNFLDKIKELFANKRSRGLYLLLFILPFVIAIGIFGFITFKEAKNLLSLATGTSEANPKHQITSMNYELRDDATDYQEECFAELKSAIEEGTGSESEIAGLVCKNFVADFYTWTNKQGQYDVGGMYYVYDGTSSVGDFKTQLYTQARDSFYKYISTYISEYGSENLLEVDSIEVSKASKSSNQYTVNELVSKTPSETVAYTYDYVYGDVSYPAYEVTCKWTYKESSKFDTSKYPKTCNFIVIYRNNRYEIVEASEKTLNVKQAQETTTETETTSE